MTNIDLILLDLINHELSICEIDSQMENFWLDLVENLHDLQEGLDCDDVEEDWFFSSVEDDKALRPYK